MKKYINIIVVFIAVATLLSGLVQLVKPTFVMNIVGAENNGNSSFFFALVGTFMALFGGLMVHNVYSAKPQRASVFWSMLQKAVAFVFLSLGIAIGIFNLLAIGVALFDLFGAIAYVLYMRQLKDELA
jgi:hypothetical protein